MARKVKAVIHEPYCGWYLIKFDDGSVKETHRVYKYVQKFMEEHTPVYLTPIRMGYYNKEVSGDEN